MKTVSVGGREIGGSGPVFFIAEAGVNHNGDKGLAHKLIDAAADAKADAVKFQTFDPSELVVTNADKAAYQQRTSGSGTQRAMLDALALSAAAQLGLADHARDRGLVFLSTPFDEPSVGAVVALRVPAIKTSSGDLTSLPFLRRVGQEGLPVFLSTGMGTLEDVAEAIAALRDGGTEKVILLHCVSSYPAPAADVNLRAMATLRDRFDVPVGYSDHTVGAAISLAAVALGAAVIEKHFTLDRGMPGPDHAASIEPAELCRLVADIRDVEAALGDGTKGPRPSERDAMTNLRKSVVARRDLRAGQALTEADLTIKRPAGGLPPKALHDLIGRRLRHDVNAERMILPADLE
jgi:N-acetylneuraminate synthase